MFKRMKMATKPGYAPNKEEDVELLDEVSKSHRLIVWNDDVNSFDWVILTLIEVCGHTAEQAEQCAMIIHHRGKYAVKEGDFETLRPLAEGIIDRGINATIEGGE